MIEILYTRIYICTLTHRKVNHFEKFQLVKFFSNAGELWISQEKQTPQTDETFMKIKSNFYCAIFKNFLKMFSRKSALNIFTTLQPSETIRACIFQLIGFYIEYTTIQPLWSIYYNIQISNNFFFVNTFLWCKQHQLDLVEIPVMLAKSGCDDTSDKWCWEGNRDWTLVWGGGRVEWTCKWLVSARNYSSISSQVI